MKTEQEQIEQMIRIFKNNREVCHHTSCIKCKYCDDKDCMYSSCAHSLYQAGYGNVSEYKAKIERLQSNTPQHLKDLLIEFDEMGFAPTTVCPNPDKYATEWRDRLVNCVNNATKQAQIDVLNRAKTKLSMSNDFVDICSWHIDKLIKEVNNAEDKG